MIFAEHRSEACENHELTGTAPVRGSNQSAMRAYNERLVLSLIRQFGPKPKAEIARMTGLAAQTVSVIMRALEGEGLLIKCKPLRGNIGQPSIPMGLAANGAYFLGIKVGRGGSEMVLSDFLGNIIRYQRVDHKAPTTSGVLWFAIETIDAFIDSLPEDDRFRVAGLGVAMPFRMWDWAQGVHGWHRTDLEAWETFDLVAELAKSYSFPIYMCNDASAACSAELIFGTAVKPRDFLYVYIGYFIGGGLVLDNTLHLGRTGNAAALASMPVQATSGEMCSLVDLASLAGLEEQLRAASGAKHSAWDRAGNWEFPPEPLHAWLDQAAHGIAQAVIASVCVVDCETVLIDGSMPDAVRAALVARIEREVARLGTPGVSAPSIQQGSIGYDAKVLGAASLPLSERFLVDRNASLKD